jgi:spermidine synthase/S-adenosylmethionine decarboxylase
MAAVTLDLYVCNFSQDNSAVARAAFERLLQAFESEQTVRREIERG